MYICTCNSYRPLCTWGDPDEFHLLYDCSECFMQPLLFFLGFRLEYSCTVWWWQSDTRSWLDMGERGMFSTGRLKLLCEEKSVSVAKCDYRHWCFFSHWGLGNLFYENNEAKFEQRIPANTHTHTIDCEAEYRWKFVTKLIPVAMTINEAYFRVNIPIKVPFLPECILVSVRTGYTGPNSTHSLHWCTACIHRLWWNVGGLYCWRKPGYVPEVWGKHPVRLGDHSNYTCRYRWSNRRRRIESQCSPNWAKRQPLIYPCNEYFGRICDIMVEIYSATKTVNASNMISKAHNKMLSIEC